MPHGSGAAPRGAVAAVTAVTTEEAAEVLALVAAAAATDGGEPLSEDARLALRAPDAAVRHLLVRGADGSLVGYAQVAARPGADGAPDGVTAELLVAPAARGRGEGGALATAAERAAAALAPGPVRAWSHADSPAAAALAARRGYRRARELWQMARPLGPSGPPLPPLVVPDGVRLRPFVPGADEEAWLDVNARAFAAHPEQGRWTLADLLAREGEPWFDPAGLLLAVDEGDGRLLASHWTKQHDARTGEVYVVGVAPQAQGRGLGTAVTLAGLHHLQRRGTTLVRLYVEGDNLPARRTYERLGFSRAATDVLYERP